MTRTKIDYNTNNSVIYNIRCIDTSCVFTYVGSSANFTKRKCQHKSTCNNLNAKTYDYILYKTIRENGGWDNWNMNIIEIFPCESKQHLCVREQYHIQEQENKLNSIRAFITLEEKVEEAKDYHKKYSFDNKIELSEYKKNYRNENLDKIKLQNTEYRNENLDKIKLHKKEYYDNNKNMIIKKNQEYASSRKAEKKEYDRKYRLAIKEAKSL